MAHTCPECGTACYCGGDIDDIFFGEDSAESDACSHCDGEDQERMEYFDDYERAQAERPSPG
jgi:hypothetical protein